MRVCKCVIKLDECFAWKNFVEVCECVNEWVEFSNGVNDMLVKFEILLEHESEQFCGNLVF